MFKLSSNKNCGSHRLLKVVRGIVPPVSGSKYLWSKPGSKNLFFLWETLASGHGPRWQTTGGRYFIKTCPENNREPAICAVASKELQEFSEVPHRINAENGYVITKYHGPSVYPFEVEAARLLARMQIASIGCVDDLICERLSKVCSHKFLNWISRQEKLVHPSVLNALSLLQAHEKLFYLEFNNTIVENSEGFPSVLLHNDIFNGNCYRDKEALKLFDWGLATIGHPFADDSDRFLGSEARDAFIKVWQLEGNCGTERSRDLFNAMYPCFILVRFLMLLDAVENSITPAKLSYIPNICYFLDILLSLIDVWGTPRGPFVAPYHTSLRARTALSLSQMLRHVLYPNELGNGVQLWWNGSALRFGT